MLKAEVLCGCLWSGLVLEAKSGSQARWISVVRATAGGYVINCGPAEARKVTVMCMDCTDTMLGLCGPPAAGVRVDVHGLLYRRRPFGCPGSVLPSETMLTLVASAATEGHEGVRGPCCS